MTRRHNNLEVTDKSYFNSIGGWNFNWNEFKKEREEGKRRQQIQTALGENSSVKGKRTWKDRAEDKINAELFFQDSIGCLWADGNDPAERKPNPVETVGENFWSSNFVNKVMECSAQGRGWLRRRQVIHQIRSKGGQLQSHVAWWIWVGPWRFLPDCFYFCSKIERIK